jgi:hypothetical protein
MQDLDKSFCSPKLNAQKFKVGLAMGAKQQNLVNKAYKSTNMA